ADYMPEIKSLSNLSRELVEELNAAMQKIGYWKITLDKAAQAESTTTESEKSNFNAKFDSGCLELTFSGRFDTLNSPEVLAFFEDFEKKHEIDSVIINCEKLEYISSAGLRILLIIHKSSQKGVTLEKTNQLINDILEQTGFNSIFTIKN
ncbi:MAG: STAS domain-containing protein, partial [Synergistaceae bacterium]|nr:STAS domain-containing protein [Synergistaceae bacterium]